MSCTSVEKMTGAAWGRKAGRSSSSLALYLLVFQENGNTDIIRKKGFFLPKNKALEKPEGLTGDCWEETLMIRAETERLVWDVLCVGLCKEACVRGSPLPVPQLAGSVAWLYFFQTLHESTQEQEVEAARQLLSSPWRLGSISMPPDLLILHVLNTLSSFLLSAFHQKVRAQAEGRGTLKGRAPCLIMC